MNQTDVQLIENYMRVVESLDGYALEVGIVGWEGPHRPYMVWKVFRKWRHPPSAQRLAVAQQKALQEPRFFKKCQSCYIRNNVGHILDSCICHSCAERDLGMVF